MSLNREVAMQVFPVAEKRFFLRLANGEEVKGTLCRFADEHGIGAGVLRGLGAADSAELDFYHLTEQRHEAVMVEEPTEIAALLGNLGRDESGQAVAHIHATLGRRDGSTVGGHVDRLVVGATLEIDLEVLPGSLNRKLDLTVGLRLQDSYEP
jgi:predicted DNA-binding protein with PD1-like motif